MVVLGAFLLATNSPGNEAGAVEPKPTPGLSVIQPQQAPPNQPPPAADQQTREQIQQVQKILEGMLQETGKGQQQKLQPASPPTAAPKAVAPSQKIAPPSSRPSGQPSGQWATSPPGMLASPEQRPSVSQFPANAQGVPVTAPGPIGLGIDIQQLMGGWLGGENADLFKRFTEMLSQPKTLKYLEMVSDPEFTQPLFSLMDHSNWKLLLYLQLGLLVLLFFFRAWRYSLCERGQWLKRIWIGVWTMLLYWCLAGIALPTMLLGDAYVRTLKGLYRIIQSV